MTSKSAKKTIPVTTWLEPRAADIRIKHLSAEEAELEQWLAPLTILRPRRRFVFLNPVAPV